MQTLWRAFSLAIGATLEGTDNVRMWRIVLFVVSIGLLPIVGMYIPSGVHSASGFGQNDPPAKVKPLKINNSTQSLQVSDLQRNGQEARLSLRNSSEKDIAAFKISAGSYGITLEFTPDMFKAGTVHVQSLTIPKTNNAEDEVSIVAILFEDQTGDGTPNVVRQMIERRRGENLQLRTMLPLINTALMAPEGELSKCLDAVEKAAIQLPDSLDSTESFEFRAGLHDAKERILADLRKARSLQKTSNGLDSKLQLRYFQRRYALKISKIPN